MEIEYTQKRRKGAKRTIRRIGLYAILISFIMTSLIIGLLYFLENRENTEKGSPFPEVEQLEQGSLYPLMVGGNLLDGKLWVQDGQHTFLPFHLFQSEIDPTAALDQESEAVIITTEDKVIKLNTKQIIEEVKGEVVELEFPLVKINETLYIPYDLIQKLYPINVHLYETSGVAEIEHRHTAVLNGTIIIEGKKKTELAMRMEPSIKSYIVTTLTADEEVKIYHEENDWYYVQSQDGFIGYVPKKNLIIGQVHLTKAEESEDSYVAWKPFGQKINLTWEHVVSRTPNPDQIEPPKGVNVVSPTWFHIKDEEGGIKNIADKRYVDWAHKNGYQVWGLVTNDFNPDLTHTILSSYEKRRKVILQLIYFAELYNLDGINIDFENVYLKDKENLVQFMRELRPFMREQGLVLSIDVTIKSTSEQWSLFLDRPALGEIVDYMMVMTYDEHWGSSPVSGSVASLPWVEKGLQGILEEVSNEKVLLGVPFYTRLWKEVTEDGKTKVSSKAYSMDGIEKWMAEREVQKVFDEQSGQHYAEYYDQEEEALYRIWLEDETSIAKRVELVHKYNLAGVASWRRGFEKASIWQVIADGLDR
ncbi:glycosyl hydrolase family 18 protein [Caldalkalibacillus mannanilyticus]|uniref:glycosyl hydrolase family 18 protein n=1 Tax=Caldalkalibacillus mannanilyticus TaxID=1418 RepID=UPI00046996B5|nr:glycosyl hydrolase family 18 protein [Caldalkalibacillus mannanilyticus]